MRKGKFFNPLLAVLTLLYLGILLAVLAAVVTVHAVVSAPEGFEDHTGFHVVTRRGRDSVSESLATIESTQTQRKLPPFMSTR